MSRKLLAEAVGTAFLLAAIAGSGIMGEALANGQAGAALLPHSLAIGAILFVMITLLGPVSGAHFNPAVTMVFALNGEMERSEAAPYIATQILAGILGVLAAAFDVRPGHRAGLRETTRWRRPVLCRGNRDGGADLRHPGRAAYERRLHPRDGGVVHHGGALVHGSTSFANPAVTVARILTNTFSGIQPTDAPAFLIAQIIGALCGWRLAKAVWPEENDN